jgi:hypothetical protein
LLVASDQPAVLVDMTLTALHRLRRSEPMRDRRSTLAKTKAVAEDEFVCWGGWTVACGTGKRGFWRNWESSHRAERLRKKVGWRKLGQKVLES